MKKFNQLVQETIDSMQNGMVQSGGLNKTVDDLKKMAAENDANPTTETGPKIVKTQNGQFEVSIDGKFVAMVADENIAKNLISTLQSSQPQTKPPMEKFTPLQ